MAQKIAPLNTGRHLSTLEEAANSIELNFEMFKTQQGQFPLKQVMSAG